MTSPIARIVRGRGGQVIGPVPGAAGISASVGQGGVNRSADVKAVQVALNNVPLALGGAGERLALDGKIGPKTIEAISNFQLRWLTVNDKRCDPLGPTLGLANAMAGVNDALPPGTASMHAGLPGLGADIVRTPSGRVEGKPVGFSAGSTSTATKTAPKAAAAPPPQLSAAEQAKIAAAELRATLVEKHHLPILKLWLFTALRVLAAAEAHAVRLPTLGPQIVYDNPDRMAFLLLAKSFKLHEKNPAQALAGVRQVEVILRRMLVAVAQHLPRSPGVSPSPLVDTPLFVALFGEPPHGRNAYAYAPIGGFHLKPAQANPLFNRFVKPGKVVPELNDRMYLTPEFDPAAPNLQRLTLVHEMAHWVGGSRGASAIQELGTIEQPAKWRALNTNQRLHTAESYGFFVTECNISTQTAIVECRSDTQTVPLFPQTDANFINTGLIGGLPNIRLPPKGDVLEPKFTFPAGALF